MKVYTVEKNGVNFAEITAHSIAEAMTKLTETFNIPYRTQPTWQIKDKGVIEYQGDRYVLQLKN